MTLRKIRNLLLYYNFCFFHNNIIIRLFNSAAHNENTSDAETIENKKNKQRFYIFIK